MIEKELKNPDINVKQSITTIVKRSQIKFAPYNPKNHTKQSIDLIKKNLKNVAFLGGIVWNDETGNLIDGHKRLMALDLINKYDESNDYDIKVEKITLDPKTEKEQNVFQTRSRTDFDEELMRVLLQDIDYKNAGLDEFDLNYYGVSIPEIENNQVVEEIESLYEPIAEQKTIEKEAKKNAVKEKKEQIQNSAIEKTKDLTAYITLSFNDHNSKVAFCRRFNIDEYDKIIKGEDFSEKIELVY